MEYKALIRRLELTTSLHSQDCLPCVIVSEDFSIDLISFACYSSFLAIHSSPITLNSVFTFLARTQHACNLNPYTHGHHTLCQNPAQQGRHRAGEKKSRTSSGP